MANRVEEIRDDHRRRLSMMEVPGIYLAKEQITVMRRPEADVAYLLAEVDRLRKALEDIELEISMSSARCELTDPPYTALRDLVDAALEQSPKEEKA